jgi:hypothetical protein
MFKSAPRKKLVPVNPALSADPSGPNSRVAQMPPMAQVSGVQQVATPGFAPTSSSRRPSPPDDEPSLRFAGKASTWKRDRHLQPGRRGIRERIVRKGSQGRPSNVTVGAPTVGILRKHFERSRERALRAAISFGPESFVFSDDGGVKDWDRPGRQMWRGTHSERA